MRRATRRHRGNDRSPIYFYPRSPCGERLDKRCQFNGDNGNFYPRSPCGERHLTDLRHWQVGQISIHALLAESDGETMPGIGHISYFYPRSPCGERRYFFNAVQIEIDFYPRSPCGERLSSVNVSASGSTFLSTLSLRRATLDGAPPLTYRANFYPRSPCGERLTLIQKLAHLCLFLSTLSLRRATLGAGKSCNVCRNFYPRSPCGERP